MDSLVSTVLCTNGLQSKALAVVRSLGSKGIRVIVSEKEHLHTSGFSKYVYKTLVYPDPATNPEQFHDWCIETIQQENCDVFLPLDDDVLMVVMAHAQQYQSLCAVPIPPQISYEVACDKAKTMALAEEVGIPHPMTIYPQFRPFPADRERLLTLSVQLSYPVLLKPRSSSGGRGIRFAATAEEFINHFLEIHEIHPNPLVQECIPQGPKYDVCLCYDSDGTLQSSFVQEEVRNYPLQRGPSTVRRSVKNEYLEELAVKLMSALPWYGVVDVEFMMDTRTNQPQLMEINPRFWSSLQLSIKAGVDFPYQLYQLALHQSIIDSSDYRQDVYNRSIFPGEILHFLSNPQRLKLNPPFFTTRIPDDIFAWHDIGPTFGFFCSAVRHVFDMNAWKFMIKR